MQRSSHLSATVTVTATALYATFAPLALLAEDAPTGVQITGINDALLGSYSGTGNKTYEDEICVYNSDSNDYKISFTVSPSGSFALQGDDQTQEIPFSVEYKSLPGGTYQSVTYGLASPLTVYGSASQNYPNCGGNMNAAYQITLTQTALLAAKPGGYSGTIILFLEPVGAP